jgi:hypothetical protein
MIGKTPVVIEQFNVAPRAMTPGRILRLFYFTRDRVTDTTNPDGLHVHTGPHTQQFVLVSEQAAPTATTQNHSQPQAQVWRKSGCFNKASSF